MRRITNRSGKTGLKGMPRSLTVLLLVAATALVLPVIGGAGTCDMPVFILRGGIEANVMIILDNSHSMNTAVYHPNYDPKTIYPGDNPDPASWYYVGADGPQTFNSRDAYLVTGPNGVPGIYEGNYLNWIYWVATDDERNAIPRETRMHQAMDVLNEFITNTGNVAFGLTVFNGDDGGTIVCNCGTDQAVLLNEIMYVKADSWSPLAETMEDMVTYFQDTGGDAPFTADCQKSFLVVITDGRTNPTKESWKETNQRIAEAGVPVLVIALWDESFSNKVRKGLQQLSADSGGRLFQVLGVEQLDGAVDRYGPVLDSGVALRFQPPQRSKPGPAQVSVKAGDRSIEVTAPKTIR